MSAPAQGGPSVPKDNDNDGDKDKKSASRGRQMLTRMKTIMKRAEKRMSISGSSKAGPSTAAVKTRYGESHYTLSLPSLLVTGGHQTAGIRSCVCVFECRPPSSLAL